MELLTAARTGDEHAFTQLVDPHRRELHAHCYRLLGLVCAGLALAGAVAAQFVPPPARVAEETCVPTSNANASTSSR